MRKVAIGIYIALIVVLSATTFVEGRLGPDFAKQYVYASPWFVALWSALVIVCVVMAKKIGIKKRPAHLFLHFSLLLVFAGGIATFLTGKQGYLYLRQGVVEESFFGEDGETLHQLPFTIVLDTFKIDYYPGTNAAMDYASNVTITNDGVSSREVISMNNILKVDGYRLYQASYDNDHNNSWINVNWDPWGIGISYTGYVLFGISMIWLLFSKKEEFLSILRNPLLKGGGVLVFLVMSTNGLEARSIGNASGGIPVIPREKADSLRTVQVVYNNRIVPFNTLARDFMVKISGESRFMGLSPEQAVYSMMLFSEEWNGIPLIKIKDKELREQLGIESDYAKLTDLFEDGNYKLGKFWRESNLAGEKSSFAKAVEQTDEKVGLIFMLREGDFIRNLPDDGTVMPLSDNKIKAELLYNDIPFSKILFMVNLAIGFLSFGLFFFFMVNNKRADTKIRISLDVALFISLLFHTTGIGLRWFIAGRLPLGNGYETMQFLAWCVLLVSFIFRKILVIILPTGFLLSGFFLLVAYLGQSAPMITPLMPVLLSPWLSVHVSVIMMSYALFAFMLVLGVLAVSIHYSDMRGREEQVERVALLSRLFLYPAIFLLGAGICMGAVWANVSWGRYWGWDPKEVWALITFMVYGAAFHVGSIPSFKRPLLFHWYLIFAFITVVMTYFGVNWFFGGMHSY